MVTDAIYKYYNQLKQCKEEVDIDVWFSSLTQHLGFEYYSFSTCTINSLVSSDFTIKSNYPSNFLCSYEREKSHRHDPMIRYAFDSTAPIKWSDLAQLKPYLSDYSKDFMRCYYDQGIADGFSLPYRISLTKVAIISMSNSAVQKNIDHLMERALPVLYAMFVDLDYIMCHHDNKASPQKVNITPRETECLSWACEGKTTWEMSKIVGISERTVIFHLASASKKLGAMNRQHAIAKALLGGLIKPIICEEPR